MRASTGWMRKNRWSNPSSPSTKPPCRRIDSSAAGSPTAPSHGPASRRPSDTASTPATSWRQKASKSGAPGNRHAMPTMAMASSSVLGARACARRCRGVGAAAGAAAAPLPRTGSSSVERNAASAATVG